MIARGIALRLWWLLLYIALLLMCLRLRSWFIRHLCIARFIVLSFGGTTHTGRVPPVIVGRLGSCPECCLTYTRPHAKRCVQTRGSVRSYIGMLIMLLSSKRKLRNRLGSSLFNLPSKLVH